jgi:hypothetical protein
MAAVVETKSVSSPSPSPTSSSSSTKRVAGVEAGGQSCLVSIADGSPFNVIAKKRFETTSPAATIAAIKDLYALFATYTLELYFNNGKLSDVV